MRNHKESSLGFTLIEVLMVMALIALLSTIALPVIGKSIERAKIAKAKTEMAAMESAFKAYFSTYNEWHANLSSGVLDMDLVNMLQGVNAKGMNPNGVSFMEFTQGSLSPRGYLDPWGRPFRYAVDHNYDGVTLANGQPVRRQVTLWSSGPEPAIANDDVVSWKIIIL